MISHTGLPGHSCVRNVYRIVNRKAPLVDIEKIVRDSGNDIAGDLSMYAPLIEITHKDETKFILDEIYKKLWEPFDIAPSENVKLSVEWKLRSKVSPIDVVQTPSEFCSLYSEIFLDFSRSKVIRPQDPMQLATIMVNKYLQIK
jgi:hypothetical protein